jgi:methylisocitrate lyase
MEASAGQKLWNALKNEHPLQIVGAINAYAAIMAREAGFRALYLSGAGVANSSYGIPDIGMTTLENVVEDASRITRTVDLPLLVDIDTGWGRIEEAVRSLELAGAAGIHIEDQIETKKCGHLDGKGIISKSEMCEKIRACIEARIDPGFVVMARTDAFANEGMEGALERLHAYKEAGADMLFPEAMPEISLYTMIKESVRLPILANLTEFGKTPLFTLEELKIAGVDIALYPLSANRAMNLAALKVYREIREKGTQKHLLDQMQSREELYHFLNYRGNDG